MIIPQFLKPSKDGFTVVELITVIVVIGILTTIGIVAYSGIQRDARDKSLLSDVDSLAGIQAGYTLKNNGIPHAWYSGSGGDSSFNFTPSQGNVIDVAVAGSEYCIRAYNTAANKNSITNAVESGSTPEACQLVDASSDAGGSGGKVVGWWKLNGNSVDSSGEGRNGIISGAVPTTGQNGSPAGAYTFSSTATTSINTGYNYPLSTPSISMWVKWTGTSQNSYGTLISNTRDCCASETNQYNGFQMHLNKSNGALGSRYWYGLSASSLAYSNFPVDAWTHVALTYNGQSSSLYINGARVTGANFVQELGASSFNVFIGRGGWGNGYGFGGDIDDVRIYNYGLNAQTVKAIYDAGAV